MRRTVLVLVLLLGLGLLLGVAGCGAATTTTVLSLTTTISPTTTTTEPPPTWVQLQSAGEAPSARCYQSMVYDSRSSKVIVLGGFDGTSWLKETWAYDPAGNMWANLTPPEPSEDSEESEESAEPMEMPSSGGEIPMAYDLGTGMVMAYDGGIWSYDPAGSTWTELDPEGDLPPSRLGTCMVYDSSSGKVIIFGGTDMATCFNDMWAYDPAANTWTELKPVGEVVPPGRSSACMVYDAAGGQLILFGGMDVQFACFNDTWAYDLAANTWTSVNPAGEVPSARNGACMIYDTADGKAILFGGLDAEFACSNDTWEYDPVANAWTERYPAGGSPSVRGRASLVYVDETEQMILFGGWLLEAGPEGGLSGQTYFDDMWAYGVHL